MTNWFRSQSGKDQEDPDHALPLPLSVHVIIKPLPYGGMMCNFTLEIGRSHVTVPSPVVLKN